MIVVATFENHLFVELVISALREKGVPHTICSPFRLTAARSRRSC